MVIEHGFASRPFHPVAAMTIKVGDHVVEHSHLAQIILLQITSLCMLLARDEGLKCSLFSLDRPGYHGHHVVLKASSLGHLPRTHLAGRSIPLGDVGRA